MPEPAAALYIARTYDVPSLLLPAYYQLYTQYAPSDRDWFTERAKVQRGVHSECLIWAGRSTRTDLLDALDHERLARFEQEMKKWAEYVREAMETPERVKYQCERPEDDACDTARFHLGEEIGEYEDFPIGHDLIEAVEVMYRSYREEPQGLCGACRGSLASLMDCVVASLWNDLNIALRQG